MFRPRIRNICNEHDYSEQQFTTNCVVKKFVNANSLRRWWRWWRRRRQWRGAGGSWPLDVRTLAAGVREAAARAARATRRWQRYAALAMRWRRHGRLCALVLLLTLYAGALLVLLALPALEPSRVSPGSAAERSYEIVEIARRFYRSRQQASQSQGSRKSWRDMLRQKLRMLQSSGGGGGGGGAGAAAVGGGLRAGAPRRPRLNWCRQLSFLQAPRAPTALASFPGSGNTWVRYLLQQVTGVYTGAVYHDRGLQNNGFPGEGVRNGSVVVVKTHEWGDEARRPFERALLLVRTPGAAILAEFNRQSGGHIGHAAPDRYRRNGGKYWQQFVRDNLALWRSMNLDWALNFSGPLLLLHYETLIRNPEPPLRRALSFLGLEVSEAALRCALDRREGIYRRRRRQAPFDPYSASMKEALVREHRDVLAVMRRKRPLLEGLDDAEGADPAAAVSLHPPVS